jgi:hypothetical protein
LIEKGALCLEFERVRSPYDDIDERINGDEIPIAPWYMCESCGEIYLNLSDAGYCLWLGDDLREKLSEYWDVTGFKKLV